jgi:hypothetical protein
MLNVDDYKDDELEEILSLSFPYQQDDIATKKNELYVKLVQDNTVDNNTKTKITEFLDMVSFRLSKVISSGYGQSVTKRKGTNFNELKNTVTETNNHFIIEKEQEMKEAYNSKLTDGLHVGDLGGAPPGIINPLNYRTIKRALNIDSRFRPNYYQTSSSDQMLSLPYKFEKVISMRLASIELPLTYYAISESLGNNCFVVNWDNSGGVFQNSVLVKIPDGNYQNYNTNVPNGSGGSEIESILNGALLSSVAIPPPTGGVSNGVTIQSDTDFNLRYTVDTTSGKSVFALDLSGTSTPLPPLITGGKLEYQIVFSVDSNGNSRDNQPLPFYLGWELGYRMGTYDSGSGSTTPTTLLPAAIVSEGLYNIKGPEYIFVAIDDYNNNVNNYYVSAYSDSINNRNILARINLSNQGNSNGAYRTTETDGLSSQINRSRNYFGPVNIEKLRITLYDEYGRILNLNNMDWSCAITFECMYS